MQRLVIYISRELSVLVDCGSVILLWKKLLHFPSVLLGAYGELEIFSCDGIPVLQRLVA